MFAEGDFSIENIILGSEHNAWNKDPFENIEQYYGGIDFESYRVSREIISYVPTSDESLHAGIALTAMHHQQVLMKASTTALSELREEEEVEKEKEGGKDKILINKKTKSSINTNKKGLLNHLSIPKKILIIQNITESWCYN